MIIAQEKEKLENTPLSDLTIKDLEKRTMMEYFVSDASLLKEYKDLQKPFKNRLKYTGFVDILWFAGIIIYARNVKYYASVYYPNRRKGIGNLILMSMVHTAIFMSTLLIGNFIALRINPYTYYNRYKDINRRMMESDPHKGITWTDFMILYTQVEELEEKKAELRKALRKNKQV